MAENDKKVSAMVATQSVTQGAFVYVAAENQTSPTGYESFKITAGDLAQTILGSFSFPLVLDTTAKNVFGAINELKGQLDDGAVVLLGTAAPDSAAGVNGNIYIRYSTSGNVTTITNMYVKISDAWAEVSTGGGGGSSTLAGLSDVNISSPTNGQALVYDDQNDEWVNGNVSGGSGGRKIFVGTCSTAAGTAAKEVSISSDQGFALEVGATICFKCKYTNSASNVTISVNGGTAYPIWYSTGAYTGSTGNVTGNAGAYMLYVFDGSYWCWESMGMYNSYNAMTDAQAESASSTSNFVIAPTVLKHAIDYHAPGAVRVELTQAQYDLLTQTEKENGTIYFISDAPSNPVEYSETEKAIGHWVDGSVLYERSFYFDFTDIAGGTQSDTVINGRFDLPHENYADLWIETAFMVNDVPDGTLTIKSLPLPTIQNNGGYIRVQIQKTSSNDGYPFIYLDVNWSISQIWTKRNDIHFVFVIRYTKASS